MFETSVYVKRRKRLKELVGNGFIILTGNVDAPMNYSANTYKFRQDSTFLYFFGLDDPGLNAIIDCDSGNEIIFGQDLTMDDIIWMGPQPSLKSKANDAGIDVTGSLKELFLYAAKAIQSKQTIHILPPYRAENKILLSEVLNCPIAKLATYVSERLIKACVTLRSIKEIGEIVEIENQMDVAYLMHTTAMWMAQPGASEHQITGAVEGIALGDNGMVSFPVILTRNGQTLHNHYHGNTLQKGDLLLVDAGCESPMHYATDHTRTSAVGGQFTNRQKDIYQIVLDANNKATAAAKPGIPYVDCHNIAAKAIVSSLKEMGIMKGDVSEAVEAGAHALFFPHGLGHMMGLDVHDMEDYGEDFVGYTDTIKRSSQFGTCNLRLGRELQTNFVVTNEPGIYFIPELIDLWKSQKKHQDFINYNKIDGFRDFGGIRLEDDLLITENGARNLGKRIPITIEEVESVIQGLTHHL